MHLTGISQFPIANFITFRFVMKDTQWKSAQR